MRIWTIINNIKFGHVNVGNIYCYLIDSCIVQKVQALQNTIRRNTHIKSKTDLMERAKSVDLQLFRIEFQRDYPD